VWRKILLVIAENWAEHVGGLPIAREVNNFRI